MRKAHLERVEKGKCSAKLTKPFYKILNALDRLSNSCANVADHELLFTPGIYTSSNSPYEQVIRK